MVGSSTTNTLASFCINTITKRRQCIGLGSTASSSQLTPMIEAV